jgi:hypothetical protein
MKNWTALFPLILLSLSCAHVEKTDVGIKCLTEDESKPILKLLADTYRRGAATSDDEKAQKPVLSEESCTKRKYRIADYSMIIFRTEGTSAVKGTMHKAWAPGSSKDLCLAKAVNEITELKLPFSQPLIDQYRRKFPKTWSDSDFGPVTWLKCENQNSAEWQGSLETFLHEISHDIHDERCLFSADQTKPICFDLSDQLPMANSARLNSYPTKNERAIEGVNYFQNLYLHDKEKLLILVDEIRAYGITSTTAAASMKKLGKKGVLTDVNDDRTRDYFVLPQMLNHLLIYFENLKKSDAALFDRTLNPQNRRSLRMVLSSADESARYYFKQLKALGLKPRDVEESFWADYQKRKKSLAI